LAIGVKIPVGVVADANENEFKNVHELRKTEGGQQFLKAMGHSSYRNGHKLPAPEDRKFICWDGEGMNLDGDGLPQHYVLFGCQLPGKYITGRDLQTQELLDLVLDVAEENPYAFHVGFAFGYDSNQIVKSLPKSKLEKLRKHGYVWFGEYRIAWRPSKMLVVSRPRSGGAKGRIAATIYDCFSFFACSFVKAVRSLLGDVPDLVEVEQGKSERGAFEWRNLDYVILYWRREIGLLERLMERFRELVYSAGLRITQWHGPGALASYALKKHSIKQHMDRELPKEVTEAARYAYAGGRFEAFHIGRHSGDVWSLDINSAYPYAIAKLPSLANGRWKHVGPFGGDVRLHILSYFGVYRIRIRRQRPHLFDSAIGPVFWRSTKYQIYFPQDGEGWYWTPEIQYIFEAQEVEILEGWEFEEDDPDIRPFEWVLDYYEQRRQWKAEGNGAQIGLKLTLNSLYGKMAQRVGYDERNMSPPTYHQLEWAGWVTAYTRGLLYRAMRTFGYDNVVAVETDGFYTTTDPAILGFSSGSGLGEWEIKRYEELVYLQSGFYWARSGNEWTSKYRGFDPDSVSVDAAFEYLDTVVPGESRWPVLHGRTSRFVGIGSAMANPRTFRQRHCLWETVPRELRPGRDGKRIHVAKQCKTCASGRSASDALHDLVLGLTVPGMSTMHPLPWATDEKPDWWQEEEVDKWSTKFT
jgi:hypothetical protein